MDRRERFRHAMANLRSSGDPTAALANKLIVAAGDRSPAVEISNRLEIDPESSHLLLGGVGSGKTTTLLMVREELKAVPDLLPLLLDVSQWHDLWKLEPGALLVMAGCAIARALHGRLDSDAKALELRFNEWAYGGSKWEPDYDYAGPPDDDDGVPGHWVRFDGMLTPPGSGIASPVAEKRGALKKLVAFATAVGSRPILLFDSMDRVSDEKKFLAIVEQDLEALKVSSVGCVVAGPITALYEPSHLVLDRFEKWHLQRWVDPTTDAGSKFLAEVLAKRTTEALVPGDVRTQLAHLSGGALRDLIALAHASVEEAYLSGSETVSSEQVEKAAELFGRTLVRGLHHFQLMKVRELSRTTFLFSPTQEVIPLLVNRVIFEYRNGEVRYDIHPTIRRLIDNGQLNVR